MEICSNFFTLKEKNSFGVFLSSFLTIELLRENRMQNTLNSIYDTLFVTRSLKFMLVHYIPFVWNSAYILMKSGESAYSFSISLLIGFP